MIDRFRNLIGLPSCHYNPVFGRRVHELFAAEQPDAVALELPPALLPDLEWAASCWPAPVALLERRTRVGPLVIVPFVPGDSMLEAFRLGSSTGAPIALVDVDVRLPGEERAQATVSLAPEFAVRLGAEAFKLSCEQAVTSDLIREAAMASALADLMSRHRSVLWVGGGAHWSRIVERIRSGDFSAPHVGRTRRRRFDRARFDASALVRLTGLYPAVVEEFARTLAPFEPFDAMRRLLHAAADTRLQPCEPTAPIDLARTGLYARNLAASARIGEQPQLSELVLAANATIGPRYAARVFDAACRSGVPAGRTTALDPLTYEIDPATDRSEQPEAGFVFRGRRLSAEAWTPPEWAILDAPDPAQLTRAAHDAEYEDLPAARRGQKFHWGAYPPDEREYEAFVEFALRRASVADPGASREVPFSTGLRDGLDVRSTIRRWHEDAIYVRGDPDRGRRFRNGAIDWTSLTEESNILQGVGGGGWNDPDSPRIGSASREVGEGTTLAEFGEAVVTLRHREWSAITLDVPTSRDERDGRPTFFDAVIERLLEVQGGPLDDVYSWLEVAFAFCAGKPFVYYSRYQPSERIHDLARAKRVDLVWRPLGLLPRELVERHRTWRQLWLTKRQWKALRARLAARGGGAAVGL